MTSFGVEGPAGRFTTTIRPRGLGSKMPPQRLTDSATRDIPVVIHSVIDNRRRAEQLGADDVLVKPAPAQIIRTVLGRLVTPQAAGAREVRHDPA